MPDLRDIRPYLEQLLAEAIRGAVAAGDLPDVALPEGAIERPKDGANGDFASTVPLRLARSAMKPPLEIARAIAKHIPADARHRTARCGAAGIHQHPTDG